VYAGTGAADIVGSDECRHHCAFVDAGGGRAAERRQDRGVLPVVQSICGGNSEGYCPAAGRFAAGGGPTAGCSAEGFG